MSGSNAALPESCSCKQTLYFILKIESYSSNLDFFKDKVKTNTIISIYGLFVPKLLSPIIVNNTDLIIFITILLEDIFSNWDEFFQKSLLPFCSNDIDILYKETIDNVIKKLLEENFIKIEKKIILIVPAIWMLDIHHYSDFRKEFNDIVSNYIIEIIRLEKIDLVLEILKYKEKKDEMKKIYDFSLLDTESEKLSS